MSKAETIIQTYNDEKCQYEYSVKGYDVTESVNILLKRHKEEYDRQKFNFGEVKGYCDGMRDAENKITDLEAKLAEKDEQICRLQFEVQQALSNSLGKTIKELIEIDNQDKIELLEKARTQVAQLDVICFPEYSCSDGFESCQYRVDDIIDTLIKEIKGE
jgi:hypothetical protein